MKCRATEKEKETILEAETEEEHAILKKWACSTGKLVIVAHTMSMPYDLSRPIRHDSMTLWAEPLPLTEEQTALERFNEDMAAINAKLQSGEYDVTKAHIAADALMAETLAVLGQTQEGVAIYEMLEKWYE